MLLIAHKAEYLFREDAYRAHSWSADMGLWQPASFIYLSFEAFKDLALNYNLKLIYTSNNITSSSVFPWKFELEAKEEHISEISGLITRITNLDTAKEIEKALNSGKNVIALLPNEMLGLLYPQNKEQLNSSIKAAYYLGINAADRKIQTAVTNNKEQVWWEEIPTNTKGRLFVTKDAFLSDGFFMEGYGKNEENDKKINALLKEFSTFKYPLLSVIFRNNIPVWPCHEPLNLIIDIKNHGPLLEYLEIQLSLAETFEPLGSIERVITNFNTLKKGSFAFQIIPRINKHYKDYMNITAISKNGKTLPIHFSLPEITILPSYSNSLRDQSKQDDKNLSHLVSTLRKTQLYDEVKILPKLVQIDIKSCLNRVRSAAEKLAYLALEKNGIKHYEKKLASAIHELQKNKILSQKSIGYLHTIRVIGNLASHPTNEHLNDVDVRVASYALSCVVEEMIIKKLI